MSKFPEIEQFRHVIRAVKDRSQFTGLDADNQPIFDRTITEPTLEAVGTVKIHGTNAGVTLDEDGELECWSRTRKITVETDNAGFCKFVMEREALFKSMLGHTGLMRNSTIYGEWCGKGIMKGCAVHELDKMFVIFAIGVQLPGEDRRRWLDLRKWPQLEGAEERIFNVANFGSFTMKIDFRYPAESQNALIALTQGVEAECPVGKHFGVSGIGEGIVWRLLDEANKYATSDFWFKVKGEKHSVTKVKKLAEVDIEKLNTTRAFAEATATEQRCLQAVAQLESDKVTIDQKATGTFLRWMFNDIIKEEMDRMEASGLTKKEVGSAISKHAREWWFSYLNEQAGL